ncbi:MAG TPA: malonyl-CoA decarboxylase [Candidatus Lustribacter sp.]|nr:malonyl-CoA decarboxylase [Candidatus Lustribacter sp.]
MKSFRSIAEAFHLGKPAAGEATHLDVEQMREEMAACIEGHGGDVATRARITQIAKRYETLAGPARTKFFEVLASFDVDRAEVDGALAAVASATETPERNYAERRLRHALVPSRVRLLRAFNSLPSGVKFLVEMRADLLEVVRTEPALEPLEADLKELLASWFDLGFLEMRRISWDAPASLLEKLGRYEAVHEVRGWSDLKNRLDADRRCFAFLHPAMPDEPLIFVEVALTTEMSGEMATLLDQRAPTTDPLQATYAIFYSISNCQRGLDGISFGNALIKRVVQELAHEFRHIRTFATLSPLPRFREWIETQGVADGATDVPLKTMFANRAWSRDAAVAATLKAPLMQLAAHYLLEAKRGKRAFDPVAHFHLSNGARLERLNWLADTSARGMRESAGMMVNYLYRLDQIDDNQVAYTLDGRIAANPHVTALLGNQKASARHLPAPTR